MNIQTVTKYTRQNTGSHFLDSGDHYGRIYDAPVMPDRISWDKWGAATISVTHMLAEYADIHPLHRQFYKWDVAQEKNLPWFESADAFMRSRGYTCAARDNTCNGEHDLDQNMVWEVWLPEHDDGGDWYYSDDAVVVLFIHTGCDVRGGYSSPMFVTFDCESVIPDSFSASYWSADLPDEINDRLDHGYSGWPLGELEKAGYEWVGNFEGCEAEFRNTETGATIWVHAQYEIY